MAIDDLQDFLMGGGSTTIPENSSPAEKFLHVVAHGIDWQGQEGARSSYDFAKAVDFDSLLTQSPDLLARYLEYVQDHVLAKVDNDPSFAGAPGFDDSIVDALSVLDQIVGGMHRAGVSPSVDPLQATALIEVANSVEEIIQDEDPADEDLEAFQNLRDFVSALPSNQTPSRPRP